MIKKVGLLPLVMLAIMLGILGGYYLPPGIVRVFATFNGLFGSFLSFFIPILILAFVASGIAGIGERAGRLLLNAVLLAYGFTLFSGLLYLVGLRNRLPVDVAIRVGRRDADRSDVAEIRRVFLD